MLQGSSSEVEEALADKDEAFEFVTALLDDTLEQADAAVDTAKQALQRGDNPAISQVPFLQTTLVQCIKLCFESEGKTKTLFSCSCHMNKSRSLLHAASPPPALPPSPLTIFCRYTT